MRQLRRQAANVADGASGTMADTAAGEGGEIPNLSDHASAQKRTPTRV